MINHSELYIIFYVKDQEKSKDLYSELFSVEPVLHVPGMTEFMLSERIKLGLMPNSGINKIFETSVPHPDKATGIPKCELYLVVESPDKFLNKAIDLGFTELSKLQKRNWEHTVGYVMDSDGNVLAFAKK